MRHFFSELDKLQHEIVQMGDLVRSSILRSVRCLIERNADLADQVLRDEALINQSEIAIDEMATRLVTLNSPVAQDMRLIIAALKINTDLERMGDLAVNIARRALTLIEQPKMEVPVAEMSELVQSMVERCIRAFTDRDELLARGVLRSDDDVDRMRNEIYEDLSIRMEKDPALVRRGLMYMFIARNLERIADHATNIAEDVVFLVKGIDVRHHNEPSQM
jgi:phosphate transport system protein